MNILILGKNGTAHALAWKLSMSRRVDRMYCTPGNGGTGALCENTELSPWEIPDFATCHDISLIVSGESFYAPADLGGIPNDGPFSTAAYEDDAALSVCCIADGTHWVSLPPVHRDRGSGRVWTSAGNMNSTEGCFATVERELNALKLAGKLPCGVIRVLFDEKGITEDASDAQERVEWVFRGVKQGFGAQDAQVLLPTLNGDLVGLITNCLVGRLYPESIVCTGACALQTVSAPAEDVPISGMGKLPRDIAAFHEHTRKGKIGMIALGGAALDIVCRGGGVDVLQVRVAKAAKLIRFA